MPTTRRSLSTPSVKPGLGLRDLTRVHSAAAVDAKIDHTVVHNKKAKGSPTPVLKGPNNIEESFYHRALEFEFEKQVNIMITFVFTPIALKIKMYDNYEFLTTLILSYFTRTNLIFICCGLVRG